MKIEPKIQYSNQIKKGKHCIILRYKVKAEMCILGVCSYLVQVLGH